MPRKAYLQDLQAASQLHIKGISDVRPLSDGEFTFSLTTLSEPSSSKITILIPEVSDYPSSHECLVFASDDAPARIAAHLESAPVLSGKPLSQALQIISQHFSPNSLAPRTDGDGDSFIRDADDDDQDVFEYDPSDSDADGQNEDWAADDDELDQMMGFSQRAPPKGKATVQSDPLARSHAISDLRVAKNAGFKVGQFGFGGSTSNPCFVSVACRVAKLGISEEALEAWDLDPSQYLILLLYYQSGYKEWQEIQSNDGGARNYVEMRIGVSDTYKPRSMEDALSRFQTIMDDRRSSAEASDPNPAEKGFHETFISRPLNELLNTRLLTIIKYRLANRIDWDGAERLYNDRLGMGNESAYLVNPSYKQAEKHKEALAPIVLGDQMRKATNADKISFPLVAMQFLLRHFVRCTEFCLVCFSKVDSELEAIKPYVCDRPLCLFQYMSLGFGPSIEPEILSQPFVVDLLVSFCYQAASAVNLHEYPEGLGLSVPNPENTILNWSSQLQTSYQQSHIPRQQQEQQTIPQTQPPKKPVRTYSARLNRPELELLFDTKECPLRKGDWIVLNVPGSQKSWHCKIKEVVLFPTVRISEPIEVKSTRPFQEYTVTPIKDAIEQIGWQEIDFHIYERNFDQLGSFDRSNCIQMLLSLLPSVQEMIEYLTSNPGKTLATWTDRIPPAALGVLRWVIASNRSCIMQVDRPDTNGQGVTAKKSEDRVQGMGGYMQFRFAMGAPDKEQRFINSIKGETQDKQHQTLFAWHGSSLTNWHSIIRQGLHFNKVSHGRAYGNGCYHAKDFGTSLGYSPDYSGAGSWPQSMLRISNAVALSEIVNAPEKFVSNNPFYVVAQLDWIQTRYLFVQPNTHITLATDNKIEALDQDPNRIPTGPSHVKIALPLTAIPRGRRPRPAEQSHVVKKIKTFSGKGIKKAHEVIDLTGSDEDDSVATDDEDLMFLIQEDALATPPPSKPQTPRIPTEPVTSFIAGTLDDLPLLPCPPFASPSASKSLQKDFRTLMQVQDEHCKHGTLHELGWWMDPEHISRTDNLYQWIIQLHSFPLSLPLAKDMKKQGVEGVVMELRFPASYPYSPPFLRVVRPRFLPFQNGGGGHVTAGGSICMELLTNNGWSAVNSIESVLLQVRMAIMSTDPRPARLSPGAGYGVGEAVESFKRACQMHGWKIPEDLERTAFAGNSRSY